MSNAIVIPAAAGAAPRAPSLARRLFRNKALTIGCAILLLIVLVALFAPWLAPYDPYVQDLAHRTVPPVGYAQGSCSRPGRVTRWAPTRWAATTCRACSTARASRC